MIRFLLDTDFCIHAIRKRTKSVSKKLIESADKMALSDITLYELYYGAETYAEPQLRINVIENFAAGMRILPFDTEAARHAGNIRGHLKRTGQMIGNSDVLIAGIARSQGLVLLTGNVREFSRIDGLNIESWR